MYFDSMIRKGKDPKPPPIVQITTPNYTLHSI
jgi:hypothetical protein